MARARYCPENERIKRRYLQWLKDARGYGTASVDMAAAAISRFETYTGYRNFRSFHIEQARAFKAHLSGKVQGARSGKPLSSNTIAATLRQLKAFFLWLADQPGYRSAIRYSEAEYLTPSGADERIARGARQRPVPELHEIERVLRAMPATTRIERRDRAVVAFIILTGGRDNAVASLKLRHVDLARGTVFWDAREVRTKRAKSFSSHFFPVGTLALEIVTDWIGELVREEAFGPGDPLFAATAVTLKGAGQSPGLALSRRHWQSTAPIRAIFRTGFARAGLPYFNPHSFRSTLARLGEKTCRTPEEWKAWSQNLGHTDVMTTFSSYGQVPEHRQRDLIASLWQPKDGQAELMADLAAFLRARNAGREGP